MRIAFIGLGNMGAPRARNLIKAGHQLNLFDLNKAVLAGIRPGTPTVNCSTIDPQTARDVSKAAAAKGVDMGDAPASRGYTGGFGAELMLKDLGLATEAARQAHQPVILGAVAQQLYQAMSLRGEGGKDFSAIVEGYRKND
ncbi:3-hydroxyisobutyrate dehydrogenase [Pseudomonas monteilii SB3101]|uniref:3-hydroxyisobutyrate dehydrogenase n=2 Tax=Pseudomonas TaxID=286 RepID=V9V5F1_9PSED|nr:NAD(P)-binding domain-containing protein [Pseudomonas monteilii]AHC84551.1 3-hydroxyisobutyrate dehydrogenase [Pseudomonas monteilii SB3078]AHC89922.1 3-hydroxyisobutyrate dehydrogenase [Pseudomonas monteilii SB3101]